MATFAVTLDNGSVITFEGNLTGDLQGLPTGWTEDASNPANVATNDGGLDLGNGTLNVGGQAIFASTFFSDSGAVQVSFFSATPVGKQTVTGALSTVADAAAKDVLTSLLAALVAYGLATDGTT